MNSSNNFSEGATNFFLLSPGEGIWAHAIYIVAVTFVNSIIACNRVAHAAMDWTLPSPARQWKQFELRGRCLRRYCRDSTT